jgi:O-antigen/teichoic acid export membrane protein
VAPDFVRVVLGEKWEEAIPLLQILALVGLLQALQSINMDILQARDRTSSILRYSVAFTCVHITAFVIGLQWGVVGVAAAYAVSSLLIEPWLTWLTARSIGVSPWVLVRGLRGVFEAGVIMVACVLGARVLLIDLGVPAEARLPILVLLGIVVFELSSLWRAPEAWDDLRGIIRDVRGLGAAGEVAPAPHP